MGTTRKLQEVGQAMGSMTSQNDFVDSLNNPENVQSVDDLVEDIRYALVDYQVCTTSQAHPPSSSLIPSPDFIPTRCL